MLLSSLAAVTASAAIPRIIDNLVKPALQKLADSAKKGFQTNIEHLCTHFADYLTRAYEKNRYLNTLVYPNQQKQLRDLYIPLTIIQDRKDSKEIEKIKIDNYPYSFISKYRHVLIMDTAGMGKSTLTKIMFLSAIDQEAGIPFSIELRRLSKSHLLLDEIRDQLGSLTKDFDDSLMRIFFEKGGFIFFFDGLDEVSVDERSIVIADIKHFIEKAPNNHYIMTSRPEQALAGFGDFLAMRIHPLEKEEAFALLSKYDSGGEISQRLIEKLKSGDYDRIRDFMQNPLLVSLLFIGFEYKPDIPLRINEFYEQVFDALYNRHDLSKDGYYSRKKLSGLEMNDFAKVLRSIGIICLDKHCLEFNRSDFLEIITQAGKLSNISLPSAKSMMDDLLHAVPLFCQDGLNYKWVHKSMQEFFAADFISRDSGNKKEKILERILNSSNLTDYSNLINIFSDLDRNSFQRNIVLPALENYISYVDSPIPAYYSVNEKSIRTRRQILYRFENDLRIYAFTEEALSKHNQNYLDNITIRLLSKFPEHMSSHILNTNWLIIKRPHQRIEFIFRLINRKYQLNRRSKRVINDVLFIEKGKPLFVSQSLYIDNPKAYDELNTIAIYSIPSSSFLHYDEAKKLRDSIKQQICENESVLDGLLEW